MKIKRRLLKGIDSIEIVYDFLIQPGLYAINQRFRHIGVKIDHFNFDVISYIENNFTYKNCKIRFHNSKMEAGFLLIIYWDHCSEIIIERRRNLRNWETSMVYIENENPLYEKYETVYNRQHPDKAVSILDYI